MPRRLEKDTIYFKDGLMASALTAGSIVLNCMPAKMNLIQNTGIPSFTPAYWHKAHRPAKSLGGQWVEFNGIKGSSVLPSKFTHAGIIYVDGEEMDRKLSEQVYSLPAATYAIGTAAMIGSSHKYAILGLEHEDDQDYKVAMGIGQDPLIAQVGIEFPIGHTMLFSRGMVYTPLEHGVRLGPVLAMNEVPESIPQI